MNTEVDRSSRCRVLATDLDGTFLPLAGDVIAVDALEQIRDQTDAGHLPLVFVTGRHLESVFDAIAEDGLPQPGWIICDVGTSIYRLDAGTKTERPAQSTLAETFTRLRAYDETLDQLVGNTDIERHRVAIGELTDFQLQESFKQGRHKLSYYVPAEKLDVCRERVEKYLADLSLPYGVISSVDPFNNDGLIDVLPNGVSKAFALDWWCAENSIKPDEVVFCGDSGNDFAALIAGYRAVVVGNAARSLAEQIRQTHAENGWTDRLCLANATSTGGVLEGLRWFGLIRQPEDAGSVNPNSSRLADSPPQREQPPQRPWGARLVGHRRTEFNLFAPAHSGVAVRLLDQPSTSLDATPRRFEMQSSGDGWHSVLVDECPAGTRYEFILGRSSTDTNGRESSGQVTAGQVTAGQVTAGQVTASQETAGQETAGRVTAGQEIAGSISDPASRFQPDGVHGPSVVVDPQFPWQHDRVGRAARREDLVVYEMHVGAFTDSGTFAGAIERLDELVELGITAIELMPIAQCPGRWNWGYDATHWFAPMNALGTPTQMRQFVDAAHARGLLVFADVVYNHFGPEGNHWSQLGDYLSAKHHTPWGSAPNFDEGNSAASIRRLVIDNAIYWLDEFHLDGLRVDAIHCMADDSDEHITRQFGREVRQWSVGAERRIWLIAESNVYDASMIADLSDGGNGFDAQWCDDFAHSLFAVVRPGERLTVRTYEPRTDFAGALRRGFLFQGDVRGYRGREADVPDDVPAERVDSSGLIYCIQNHDFIGNHPTGQRFHHVTSVEAQAAAAAMLILSPAIPMLFMGEEFACEHPFAFFVDFGDESLKQAVITGRQREYPQHDWSGGVLPTDRVAFDSAKIGPAKAGNAPMRNWYRELIGLRKRMVASGLLDGKHLSVATEIDANIYVMHYHREQDELIVAGRLTAEDASENPAPQSPKESTWIQRVERLLDRHSGLGACQRDSLHAMRATAGSASASTSTVGSGSNQTMIWF